MVNQIVQNLNHDSLELPQGHKVDQEKICLKEFGNTRISKGCQFVFTALFF